MVAKNNNPESEAEFKDRVDSVINEPAGADPFAVTADDLAAEGVPAPHNPPTDVTTPAGPPASGLESPGTGSPVPSPGGRLTQVEEPRSENVSDTLEEGVCKNVGCEWFGRALTNGVCSKCGYTAEKGVPNGKSTG